MKNKKIVLVFGIIVAMIGVLFLIFVAGLQNIKKETGMSNDDVSKTATNKSIQAVHETAPELNCDEGWSEYKHDVLGIEFCYPNEWGKPGTDYLKNITSLPDMDKTFEKKNVHYENSLDIIFKENKNIRIKFFNEQFTGKDEEGIDREWDYHESGSTGDVINLKKHGDICKYKIGYDYPNGSPASFLREIYSDCEGSVKIAFTENDKGPRYNSYDLRLLSFVRLSNNYFDNVLISYKIDSAQQINETISTFDEFFTKTKIRHYDNEEIKTKSREEFNNEKNTLEQFTNSIKVFKPVVEEKKEFEEISGEDPSITTIRKYYWLIMTGDLESAYKIYGNKNNKTFEEFKEMYGNVYSVEPFDFSKKENGNYEFYVNYQDHNSLEEKFHVIMNVSDNVVKTIFLEKYLTDIVSFKDMQTYSAKRGEKNYLFLNKNGREIVVDEGDSSYDEDYENISVVKYFHEPNFSPKGNYLIYGMSGWEWYVMYVYDIDNEKIVDKVRTDGASGFSFTPNEEIFYLCTSSGIASGPGGSVYSVPGFKTEYDLLKEYSETERFMNVDCSYDQERGIVLFELTDYYSSSDATDQQDKEVKIEYSVDSNKSNFID